MTNNTMNEVKLMTIDQKTICNVVYPRILFSGVWLTRFGFEVESLVSAFNENKVLTLKAVGVGMDAYKRVVHHIRKNKGQLFQVLNTVRSEGIYLDLAIEGIWLKRQGFHIGQVILVRFSQGIIEIKPLNPVSFGFKENLEFRILQVARKKERNQILPRILLTGTWLLDMGFPIGSTATVTYRKNAFYLKPCANPPVNNHSQKKPTIINIGHLGLRHDRTKRMPSISFSGIWLDNLGFHVGDYLLVGMRSGYVRVQRLEIESLFNNL